MQPATVGHLVYNINTKNTAFYKDLFVFLGLNVLYDVPEMIGVIDEHGVSLWLGAAPKEVSTTNDYDGPGLNHLGLSVKAIADVDAAVDILADRGVTALFETPRHRPEFSAGPDQTYYQVMFESPDSILFEIVYTGPKE